MANILLLVVGLRGEDSGKTMVSLALMHCLAERGVRVCGFKPRAGNNLWFDYDVVYEALSQGRLYGKDAKLLKKASNVELLEEELNPVHRLWVEKYTWYSAYDMPAFLADRVTLLEGSARPLVVVNSQMLDKYRECESILSKLCMNAREVILVQSIEELNEVTQVYDKCIAQAYNKVNQICEAIIVESYSDIALPWSGLEKADAVFGVEPWSIKLYDPEKYFTAVKLSSQLKKVDEISIGQVQRLLKPIEEIRVMPSVSNKIVEDLKNRVFPVLKRRGLI